MTLYNKSMKYKFIALRKQIISLLAVCGKPQFQDKHSFNIAGRNCDFVIKKYFSGDKIIFTLWE